MKYNNEVNFNEINDLKSEFISVYNYFKINKINLRKWINI